MGSLSPCLFITPGPKCTHSLTSVLEKQLACSVRTVGRSGAKQPLDRIFVFSSERAPDTGHFLLLRPSKRCLLEEKKMSKRTERYLAPKLDWPFLCRARQPLVSARLWCLPGPRQPEDHITLFGCTTPWLALLPTYPANNNTSSSHSALTLCTCSQRSQGLC